MSGHPGRPSLDNVSMPTGIGETLREARHDAGIELDEVERTIRIRGRYLAALENEEWDVLPAEAYLRGFLHTYADYLGLDGAELVDRYDRLGVRAEPEPSVEVPFEPPRPIGDGNVLWRRAGAIAIGVAGALVLLFVVLAVTGDSEKNAGGHRHHHGGKSGSAQATTTTSTTAPTEASVTLEPTGTVWVCLVDHSGSPLVNG